MYIGLGIFLIVVGAILTFALNASVDAVNLGMIGWICMAAGVLAILLSLIVTRRATTGGGYSSRRVSHTDPATGTRVDEVDVDRDRGIGAPAPHDEGWSARVRTALRRARGRESVDLFATRPIRPASRTEWRCRGHGPVVHGGAWERDRGGVEGLVSAGGRQPFVRAGSGRHTCPLPVPARDCRVVLPIDARGTPTAPSWWRSTTTCAPPTATARPTAARTPTASPTSSASRDSRSAAQHAMDGMAKGRVPGDPALRSCVAQKADAGTSMRALSGASAMARSAVIFGRIVRAKNDAAAILPW